MNILGFARPAGFLSNNQFGFFSHPFKNIKTILSHKAVQKLAAGKFADPGVRRRSPSKAPWFWARERYPTPCFDLPRHFPVQEGVKRGGERLSTQSSHLIYIPLLSKVKGIAAPNLWIPSLAWFHPAFISSFYFHAVTYCNLDINLSLNINAFFSLIKTNYFRGPQHNEQKPREIWAGHGLFQYDQSPLRFYYLKL